MLTGGRVIHHLERLMPDERNLIMLAGYQAPGTRGRLLADGVRTLRMHGADRPLRAQVMTAHGLSAHADADELMRWLQSGPTLPKRVFLTHGEPSSAQAMALRIRELGIDVTVPALGEEFDIDGVTASR